MSVYKHPVSGAWIVSWCDRYLVTRTYYGYTKREALAAARAERAQLAKGGR